MNGWSKLPLITIFKCEEPCGKEIKLEDRDMPEQAEVLQVTDALGTKLFFHNVECLRKWAATYECPYLVPPSPDKIDDLLPGLH